jgi:hypothetical protein
MMPMVSTLRRAAALIGPAGIRGEMEIIADRIETAIRLLVQASDPAVAAQALKDLNGNWAAGCKLHEKTFGKPVYTLRSRG